MNFTFDGNEWFMIVTSALAFGIVLRIRKHFQPVVLYIVWLFEVAYVETIDYALAGSPFRVYFCADNLTYEPAAAVIHIFLYPSFGIFFLYFYPHWNKSWGKLLVYLMIWTGISLAFEWLNVIAGVFTYTGWNLVYSIPTYPISGLILIKVYHFIEKNRSMAAVQSDVNKGS